MGGTFRDLKCWQKAFDLTVAVYAATRAFPKEENCSHCRINCVVQQSP